MHLPQKTIIAYVLNTVNGVVAGKSLPLRVRLAGPGSVFFRVVGRNFER
ncbi:MAG: hypothetical protein NT154_19465 [Verrucomicrobia bacterium]|nr:hypothetical protein [Verrucomicrobiota bacterium]